MSTESLVTMFLVLALVWGGLSVLLVLALRRERQKSGD
jgi:hypothetical protein